MCTLDMTSIRNRQWLNGLPKKVSVQKYATRLKYKIGAKVYSRKLIVQLMYIFKNNILMPMLLSIVTTRNIIVILKTWN